VNADREPVEIVSKKGTAFLVSEAQDRSMSQTAYLMRSPANAERLLRGVAQAPAGRASDRALIVE
jgi:antitoxin YefM